METWGEEHTGKENSEQGRTFFLEVRCERKSFVSTGVVIKDVSRRVIGQGVKGVIKGILYCGGIGSQD